VTNSRYSAILFDLDDTLLDFCAGETKALRKALAIVDINISDDQWITIWQTYQPISNNYWQQKQSNSLSRQQVITASLQDTFTALDYDFADSSRLAQIYWDVFCHTACLNPEVLPTIEALSNFYQLGIVSNGYTNSQEYRLQASGLSNYFQSVVISESVGYRKPASEIFNLALMELAVTSSKTLFVGDSITDDYQGAINAGIDFCYYQRRSQNVEVVQSPLPKLDSQPQYTIENISQLINLLDRG
jgi:YjjG family noncanonical pyrimidine nucleotidase